MPGPILFGLVVAVGLGTLVRLIPAVPGPLSTGDGGLIVVMVDDLRRVGVSILTVGQYLRPTPAHAPMTRYYHPDEFAELKARALERGFVHVESGPLVRSSYHAHEQADACAQQLR